MAVMDSEQSYGERLDPVSGVPLPSLEDDADRELREALAEFHAARDELRSHERQPRLF